GGAQPMAVTMNEGVALVVEVDAGRLQRRQRQGFLDDTDLSLDDALRHVHFYQQRREPRSIGLLGNAADVLPELVRRGVHVDVVTDQTSAHDPLDGYVPAGVDAASLRRSDPAAYVRASRASIARHCAA